MAMVYPLKIVSLIGFTGPAGPDKLPPCLLGCFSSQGRRLKGAMPPAIPGQLGALLGPHACVDVDCGRVMGLVFVGPKRARHGLNQLLVTRAG